MNDNPILSPNSLGSDQISDTPPLQPSTSNPIIPPIDTVPPIQPEPIIKPAEPTVAPTQNPAPNTMNPTGNQVKIKMPPLLWKQLQGVLRDLETELGGPVVGYYTSERIVSDDVKYFYTHLSTIGHQERLFFVLFTSGGDPTSAYRIASMLRAYCKELIIVIPEKAASAGTMLSLSGDSMLMTPLAYLTAVDTSVNHPLNPKDSKNSPVSVELEEVRYAVDVLEKNSPVDKKNTIYETIFNYIHPVAYGNMVRTSSLSERLCKELLNLRQTPMDEGAATALINNLNHELPTHGYPITRDIARKLGLPVTNTSQRIDDLLWRYINLNRALTEPVLTDISDSQQRTEKIINVIESVGRRLSVRNSYMKRLDPIIKGWTTLRNTFKWEATHEIEENGEKKLVVDSIDF